MSRVVRFGKAYEAGDVVVTMAGMQDVNPSAINYNSSYAHEYNRGLRREPRSWRMGAKDMACSMTLPIDVVAEFEKVAPGGELARIKPFPVNIVFLNDENEMIRDVLWVKFKGNGRDLSGDSDIEYQYEMFVTGMTFNIA
ncbi:hypothetical protein LJC16_00735 [Bacteroidales bacterium OttesenSCG-928-C19]|nr:hypothetical protein [Bacteroidales bacterium OttesenSCG-928-C19]